MYSFIFPIFLSITVSWADPLHEQDTLLWMQQSVASVNGFFQQPWACGGSDPGLQDMRQFHLNWHCANPDRGPDNFGNRFFGFHKQFLQGYNSYLASVGSPRVQVWEPGPEKPIPPGYQGRPRGTACTDCQAIPPEWLAPPDGMLNTFRSASALGWALIRWHNDNHGFVASASAEAGASGRCSGGRPDMGCAAWSPNDPIFYSYHHVFDEIQDNWRTLQPTDVAIVLDRSGSMALPGSTGSTSTRLDAAKSAAAMFADLVDETGGHKIGMVSFSTQASSSPDMPLTDPAAAPGVLAAALARLTADGMTSIGDGLIKGQALVASGAEERKAILLMTDGEENRAPMIRDAYGPLGDATHVCSIGLGTSLTLNGPKMSQLAERQGGIYISTPDDLELKKFFVFCFANIFDSFVGEDPLDVLEANELVSAPTVHRAVGDEKVTFILGWDNETSPLRLAITTPSGSVLDLNAPDVTSKVGPSWHIVRIKTPYFGETDGDWTARVVRPVTSFVNGFTPRSFVNASDGLELFRAELSVLCGGPNDCRHILYYEDQPLNLLDSFDTQSSVYADGLAQMTGRGILGNVTMATNATEFDSLLRDVKQYDLLVYSSQFAKSAQTYDARLAEILCARLIKSIVSDTRGTTIPGATDILKCAGAGPGQSSKEYTHIYSANSSFVSWPAEIQQPPDVPFPPHPLFPADSRRSSVQATYNNDTRHPAVIAVGASLASRQRYFVTVLTRGRAKVKPWLYRNNTYTLEDLHPTFRLPITHRPPCGFSSVNATVTITRPLASTSNLTLNANAPTSTTLAGDTLGPRAAAAQVLGPDRATPPTTTITLPLWDDGTHGDTVAGDHFYETAVPPDLVRFDGEYHLHARFRLCTTNCGRGAGTGNETCGAQETCILREAHQTIFVTAGLAPSGTKVSVQNLGVGNGGRARASVKVTPGDARGTLLGPGFAEQLVVTRVGDVVVEAMREFDGRGTYEILVSYVRVEGARMVVAMFGRPGGNVTVALP
ncbi:von Willebrand factor type A domain-containing protein [Immersiella caudata]|uniref:von Willebrand factor type A domain-containing protein n=1 Tax=Immersiella caudata TaxID=314043 RepID=A0AA39XIZ2_9PEZI|nr:von Willebrand factor type A domain-containing protein [Immersiella caudata]